MTTLTSAQAAALFTEPPTRTLDAPGGGTLAYRRVGQGPDVLFVHGWPVSGATFRNLLPHLTPHVTCHLIDLVGAGSSSFDRRVEISLDAHIKAVRHVLDALALDDVAVVGHDSGGLIARHALAGDPRLRAMVLMNTEQLRLHWRFRQFLWMARLPGFAQALGWAVMRRTLRRSALLLGGCFEDQALLDGDFEALFLKPLRDDPMRRWAAGQLAQGFDLSLVRALPEVHARITAPVLLAWGVHDPFFPLAWARDMLKSFPDARLHPIPDARLFVHEERPEAVAAAILPTLLGAHALDQRAA